MKLNTFFTIFLKFILGICILISSTKCDIKKESQNKKSACSISSIYTSSGSGPVMVYSAKNNDKNWRITVLEKDQFDDLSVEGDLFYTDKKTHESWFINESIDEKSFESLRDAFSLCKELNVEHKNSKDSDISKEFEGLRTEKLPSFIAKRSVLNRTKNTSEEELRIKENKINEKITENNTDNLTKSFLQIGY